MPCTVTRVEVKDVDVFKNHFESLNEKRTGKVEKWRVFTNADNPNEVWVIKKLDDLGKARAHEENAEYDAIRAKSGIVGKPEVFFLNDAFRGE